jgi:hypothetical protein
MVQLFVSLGLKTAQNSGAKLCKTVEVYYKIVTIFVMELTWAFILYIIG